MAKEIISKNPDVAKNNKSWLDAHDQVLEKISQFNWEAGCNNQDQSPCDENSKDQIWTDGKIQNAVIFALGKHIFENINFYEWFDYAICLGRKFKVDNLEEFVVQYLVDHLLNQIEWEE